MARLRLTTARLAILSFPARPTLVQLLKGGAVQACRVICRLPRRCPTLPGEPARFRCVFARLRAADADFRNGGKRTIDDSPL